MKISEPDFDPYTLGQLEGGFHQQLLEAGYRLTFVLDWGQPCKIPGTQTWGAYANDGNNTCHAISEFETQMSYYIDGYCAAIQSARPGGLGQYCGFQYSTSAIPITLAIGLNNCVGGDNCANVPTDPSNAITYGHGQAWATMVNNVYNHVVSRGYSYQLLIAGALDIEGAWNTYGNTKNWIDGYKATTFRAFYNYGNCDCPDGYSSSNNDVIGSGIFPRDWSYNRIHEVSYRGLPGRYPLPQIYHTSGLDARRWQGLSKWAVVNSYGKMIFRELLTTNGACAQGYNCTGISNSWKDAVIQMTQALNADSQTAGGLASPIRSTDINWYPR